MPYTRDYNDILNEILDGYRNLAPIEQVDIQKLKEERPEIYNEYLIQGQPDLSEGSILFIRASCTASMLWGLYKAVDSVANQIFVQTALREYLERHASDYDVNTIDQKDIEVVNNILDKKRKKRAGGNKYDYVDWCKEITNDLSVCNPAASEISNSGMGNFSATYSVDGGLEPNAKAWDTDTAVAGAYVLIDLGEYIKRSYTKLSLVVYGEGSTSLYDIKASNDNVEWTTASSGFNPSLVALNEVTWNTIGEFRYWKIELTNVPGAGPYVLDMKWFEGPEIIKDALPYPLAQGEGTWDVVIVGNLGRGNPSSDITAKVQESLENKRPMGSGFSWGMRVCKPEIVFVDISIDGTGASFDKIKTKNAIIDFVDSLRPGATLYLDQIRAIAVSNGSDYVTLNNPTVNVVPTVNEYSGQYQMVRSGLVTVL